MKRKLILNACSASFPARAREMCGFAADGLGDLTDAETIIIHDGRSDRQSLLDRAFTGRVLLLATGDCRPETLLKILPDYCRDADLILFPGDCFGEEMAVRLAFRLGGGSLVAAESLTVADGLIFCGKKVYSQHLQASFKMTKSPAFISIARGLEERDSVPPGQMEIVEAEHASAKPDFIVSSSLKKSEKADEMAGAARLAAAGQGLGGPEGIGRLGELAQAMGAALGVTRAVVMNAWAPLDKLVGVSGAMTRPDLCLTFGVSGAPAFYAGIEKSGFIISVNHDPKAPIIRQSDVAVIDDCVAVLDELRKLIVKE